MSFNIEVQGGKNYLLPTAGKYCPQDIEIAAIGGATEGMYCWAKLAEEPELPIGYTPLESLALTGANYFITDYTVTTANFATLKVVADIAITGVASNNYGINGCAAQNGHFYFGKTSNGQYGYSVRSDSTTGVTADTNRHIYTLDVPNKKYTVDSVVDITTNPNTAQTINKAFIIGGYVNTGYGDEYMPHAETIWSYKFYENDVLVRNYIPVIDNNGVTCLYDTVTGVKLIHTGSGDVVSGSAGDKVVADGYVLSDNLNAYPQDGYGEDGFYYKRLEDDIPWHEAGSYVWSKSDAGGNLISYVVSDDSSEFPEDGQGDDGYYYKLQEMGLSVKYANGTGTLSYQNSPTSSNAYATATFTVEGLGFRPQSVCWYCISNQSRDTSGYAISTGNGITTRQTSYSSVYANKAASFTDDGFSVDIVHNQVYNANNWPVYWWATGV